MENTKVKDFMNQYLGGKGDIIENAKDEVTLINTGLTARDLVTKLINTNLVEGLAGNVIIVKYAGVRIRIEGSTSGAI